MIAYGGYLGNDPVMDVAALAERVKRGEVRYAILGASRRPAEFDAWVRANGTPVDPTLWRSLPPEGRRPIALYDLKR
ncbi:MAG: hypothetical protein IBJ17_09165 [Reyranella sp.]|nr:hypothetical protein [Reyranella sp.]